MKKFIIILALSFSIRGIAQDDTVFVVVVKDPRIDMLVKKQIEINEATTRNSRRSAPGYRILVISTNDRNKAMAAKSKVYQFFPELKVYIGYQSPSFKLKVGNFKERIDAESYLESIQRIFKTGVYIIKDIIEVKPEKWPEIE